MRPNTHEWAAFARIAITISDVDTLAGSFSVKLGYPFRIRSARVVPDLNRCPQYEETRIHITCNGNA
jgi:hypothetical protein